MFITVNNGMMMIMMIMLLLNFMTIGYMITVWTPVMGRKDRLIHPLMWFWGMNSGLRNRENSYRDHFSDNFFKLVIEHFFPGNFIVLIIYCFLSYVSIFFHLQKFVSIKWCRKIIMNGQ